MVTSPAGRRSGVQRSTVSRVSASALSTTSARKLSIRCRSSLAQRRATRRGFRACQARACAARAGQTRGGGAAPPLLHSPGGERCGSGLLVMLLVDDRLVAGALDGGRGLVGITHGHQADLGQAAGGHTQELVDLVLGPALPVLERRGQARGGDRQPEVELG